MEEIIMRLDREIILAVQRAGDWLFLPMFTFTVIGSGFGMVFITALILWGGRYTLGFRLALVYSVSVCLNSIVKLGIRAPRPYWVDSRIQGLNPSKDFGMPSGHAQGAGSLWGYAGFTVKKRGMTFLAMFMIFFIGTSRIYLGVHTPTQVLAGWLFGLLVAVAAVLLSGPVRRTVERLSLRVLLLALLLLSFTFIAGGFLMLSLNPGFSIPEDWVTNALVFDEVPLNPLVIDTVLQSAAVFFGLSAGGAYLYRKHSGLTERRKLPTRIILLRYLIGSIGLLFLLGIFGVLKGLFGEGSLPDFLLTWLEYAIMGVWITGISPLVFQRFAILSAAVHQ